MQEHFVYTLRVYCTKSMLEWKPLPYLSNLKIYHTPGKVLSPPTHSHSGDVDLKHNFYTQMFYFDYDYL